MGPGTIEYMRNCFGKIMKIRGKGERISIPNDFDNYNYEEIKEELWDGNKERWTFDGIIFENCTFNFTTYYVFIDCAFLNCNMSGIDPECAVLTSRTVDCINVKGTSCPSSGDFTGYKIAYDVWTGESVLITLHVPKDAERRGNGFDKKFRVSCAQVVDMRFADGAKCQRAYSGHNPYFLYGLNDMVEPEYRFDRDYATCASGIHMFLDPEDAIGYAQTWSPQIHNVPRYVAVDNRQFGLSLAICYTPNAIARAREIEKEDGPCPYPERLEMDELGDWSWVNAERKDR